MNVDIWEVVIYHTGMYVYALWVGKQRPMRPMYSGAACFNRAYLVSEFLQHMGTTTRPFGDLLQLSFTVELCAYVPNTACQ